MAARFKEFLKKYGKAALGVHFSVSAASISGLYVAIKSNVDVESLFEKVGLGTVIASKEEGGAVESQPSEPTTTNPEITDLPPKSQNWTAEIASSAGGALAFAVLCNETLFPVRVPITIALTPPISRF